MNRLHVTLAAAATSIVALQAHAQSPTVNNPSFENPEPANTQRALNWREFNTIRRRTLTDGLNPPALVRSGTASMELAPGNVFVGCDTNEFNSQIFLWNDPVYEYGCGPAIFRYWYAIPASHPLDSQPGGIKMEFRRDNQSVYIFFEAFPIRTIADGETGHTDGNFEQVELIVWPAQIDFQHLYANMGNTYGSFPTEAPTRVSLLPFRFGGDWANETGRMFADDVTYTQDTTGASGLDYTFWDDQEVAMEAIAAQPGVVEPPVPIIFSGDSTVYNGQLGFGCQPSSDTFQAININDRVPNTFEYPQTFADIVANGYVRGVVQNLDGTTGSFGASVITGPSFRPLGEPLDLIPDVTSAGVDVTYNFPNYVDDGMGNLIPDGPPQRSTFTISGSGEYGSRASLASTRGYPDPLVGESVVTVDFTWTANQNINLETARAVGNDAFRLITISSMFASRAAGEYDTSYVEVQESGGGTTQLILSDSTPRGQHLFASPVATAVGNTFTAFQDTDATFNPGSPTVEVTIDALTGVSGAIGVQGFLDNSVNPNDDSLTIWLEWVDAPTTISSGTVITGSFTLRFLPPTAPPSPCIGDLNGDGQTDIFDFGIFAGNFGRTDLTPFTGGDLDGDGDCDVFDFSLFAPDFGCGT